MIVSEAIKRKIARLRGGNPPRFMDLFAGCGGITLGFVTAGYELVASVESDARAADSHGADFAAISLGKHREAHFKACDNRRNPASIFHDLGISGPIEDQVEVLVGGPPRCQHNYLTAQSSSLMNCSENDPGVGVSPFPAPTMRS